MRDKKTRLNGQSLAQLCKKQDQEIEQLKTEIEFYKETLSEIPGNVYWKDKQGAMIGFNKNLKRILKKTQQLKQLTGDPTNLSKFKTETVEYTAEFMFEGTREMDMKVITRDQTEISEEEGFDLQGNPATYFSQKTPLHNAKGEVIGLVGISIDVTEQKRLEVQLRKEKEEAIKANLAKSRFLAVVNHEIRTPVSSIVSLVELLQDIALDENASGLVNNLDDCAKHLLQLINSLLEFNRLELEQAPPELEPFDIRDLAQSIQNILHNTVIQKHISFSCEIDSSVPNYLIGDVRFIKHILINLINNSIKFTHHGMVALSIHYDLSKKQLHLVVKDTGIGIAQENIDKIFLPFQQIKDTYVRDTSREGTGLGLSIVKALVDKLNGRIHLDSELGKGSSFSISFPCEFMEKLPEKKPDAKPISLPKELKILMIEDDPTIQLIHQKIFRNLNISLSIAKNASEGLELIAEHDLLFLDLSLPDLSGFDVIEKIRNRQDKTKNIPIIVLTAYSESAEKNRALELGANLFLSKPLNIKKIQDMIHSVLNQTQEKK